jgi:hypothetical protein
MVCAPPRYPADEKMKSGWERLHDWQSRSLTQDIVGVTLLISEEMAGEQVKVTLMRIALCLFLPIAGLTAIAAVHLLVRLARAISWPAPSQHSIGTNAKRYEGQYPCIVVSASRLLSEGL